MHVHAKQQSQIKKRHNNSMCTVSWHQICTACSLNQIFLLQSKNIRYTLTQQLFCLMCPHSLMSTNRYLHMNADSVGKGPIFWHWKLFLFVLSVVLTNHTEWALVACRQTVCVERKSGGTHCPLSEDNLIMYLNLYAIMC